VEGEERALCSLPTSGSQADPYLLRGRLAGPCPATRARGRNFTQPNQTPSQTGGERGSSRASAGRQQCRRCRAGARRTARSRTPPPSASPTSTPTSRSAVESSCPPSRRARICGGVRRPRCVGIYGFLRFLMILFAGSGCGDREGHQPRGEPAQGAPPAQCVDSSFIPASDFWLNLAGDETRELAGSSSAVLSPPISRFASGV
jgi:hypothetical protein